MTLKVLQMIKRLCFAILLVMLTTLTPVYAFQESDLTTKAPPCMGKVSGPLKDNRGFPIPNPRWVDIKGNGICDVIGADGGILNATIAFGPGSYYCNRDGKFETFWQPGIDIGIQAIYYLRKGGAPYFVTQGGRLDKETNIARWNPKDKNFGFPISTEEKEAILRFHMLFMVEQAIKEINKGHVAGDVVALYVAMVQISADQSGGETHQSIIDQQEILTNAMIDAANRAEAKKGIASKSKTNAQKVK